VAARRTQPAALWDGLTAASHRLREVNSPDLAAWIDLVQAPGGADLVRKAERAARPERAAGLALPITMPKDIRDAIQRKAQAAGANTTADVVRGIEAYLAGEFTPGPAPRSPYGAKVSTANLGVRLSQALRDQVAEKGGPAPAFIARDWLMRLYEVGPYAPEDTSSAE
jgi:hypothetical protein